MDIALDLLQNKALMHPRFDPADVQITELRTIPTTKTNDHWGQGGDVNK